MSFVLTGNLERMRRPVQYMSYISGDMINLVDSILVNVNDIQSYICESFPALEADMLERMAGIAYKALKESDDIRRMNYLIQEYCCDIEQIIETDCTCVYAAPAPILTSDIFNDIF